MYKAHKIGPNINEIPPKPTSKDSLHYTWAKDIGHKYGLNDLYSIDDIVDIWEKYSALYAAGWLQDSKASVEHAFGVKLEETS